MSSCDPIIRGARVIEIGKHTDPVLFDPATVIDRASFAQPRQPGDSIVEVWVNGNLGRHDKISSGVHGGRFVTRQVGT